MKQTIWQRSRLTIELFPEIAPTVWAALLYGGTFLLVLMGISFYAMPDEGIEGAMKLGLGVLLVWKLIVWIERASRRRQPQPGSGLPMVPPPGFVGPRPTVTPMKKEMPILRTPVATKLGGHTEHEGRSPNPIL